MRFRAPIIQPGLTRTEAEETRARYLRINPGARVTIDSQPDNPQLKTLIAHLPVLPYRQDIDPGLAGHRRWRAYPDSRPARGFQFKDSPWRKST